MAEAGIAGMGRLTLSRHERMVMVEPRGSGMALSTLRAAEEVQPAQFGRPRAIWMSRWWRSPARSSDSAWRHSTRAPRPLPRGIAGADRNQAEGPPHQTPRGHHAATGDRSDGGPETQSRTGNACNGRHQGQAAKASQIRSRSSTAVIASTRGRRSKKEGGARDPAGRHRPEAAKEGLSAAIKHFCEGDHAGSTERGRLSRYQGITPLTGLWSSRHSFVLSTPLLLLPLDRAGCIVRLWFPILRNRPWRIDPAHHRDRCGVARLPEVDSDYIPRI